ncbi:MAG: TonB-dependent receptor [Pseudomonadales bacterium]
MRYLPIALLGFSIVAHAENKQPESDRLLETINITASRTPLKLRETGSSISILDRDQILRRNAANLGELLRQIPGISVNQQGSMGAVTQVRMRGTEANQVLVIIDGVEANDISQGSEFNFTHLLTRNIDRVEIVRGPQSALYGSDALAGVINIITTPQGLADTHYSGYAEGGSFNTIKTGISLLHGSNKNQINFSADFVDTDGTNISRSGSEDDGYKNVTFNLSGKHFVSDDLALSYVLRHTDSTTEFDGADFVNTGLPIDADYKTESTQIYGGFTLSYEMENLSQSLKYTRTDFDNVNRTDAPVDSETRGLKEQYQYQANLIINRNIVSGVLEYENEDYKQRGEASFFGDPNKNLETDTKSIALEYRFNGEFLNVSLSARNDNNADFDNSTTWRATAAWSLSNNSTNLFTSVGEGIKNPTFTERFGFFDTFIGNPDLKPEQSLSWEIGIRQSLFDDRALLTATWFNARLEDEINGFVFDPGTGSFTAVNVDGESSREGLELSLDYQFSEHFSMAASYTYLDATQEDGTGDDITEVRRPENSGSISANYNWGKANINLLVAYTGSQEDDFFPPFPPYQERVGLDSYTLVSISSSYQVNRNIELTLQLENAFDDNYEEVFGYASPGLAVYGGVRMRW